MMLKKKAPVFIGLVVLVLLVTAAAAYTQDRLEGETAVANQSAKAAAAPAAQDDAPDLANDGTFTRIHLQEGFMLDPYIVRVLAGNGRDASELDDACVGEIGAQPNAVLDWSGETAFLNIFVYSDQDVTLAIVTPDGDVLCNDDADGFTLDPIVTLEDPAEGNYEIYVGSVGVEGPAHGVLAFTEIDIAEEISTLDLAPLLDRQDRPDPAEFSLPTIDLSRLRATQAGAFGDAELADGFETIEVTAVAGGEHPVFGETENGTICAGFFSIVPAYSFTWDGGGEFTVHFEGEENASLLLVTPDGVVCHDNDEDGNLNPVIDILDGAEGEYDVHIGSFDPNSVVLGSLTIANDTEDEPASLTIDQ